MNKRKPSERTLFERWWRDYTGMIPADIRERRAENGYEETGLDWAWIGWCAGRQQSQLSGDAK